MAVKLRIGKGTKRDDLDAAFTRAFHSLFDQPCADALTPKGIGDFSMINDHQPAACLGKGQFSVTVPLAAHIVAALGRGFFQQNFVV